LSLRHTLLKNPGGVSPAIIKLVSQTTINTFVTIVKLTLHRWI